MQPVANNTQKPAFLATLKVALLIVAGSFLAYSIYWAINNIIWFNTITGNLLRVLQIQNLTSLRNLQFTLLFIQEYASVLSGFVLLVSGIFALYATVLFLRKDPKYLGKLRITILFTAIFSLLLVPSSIHHLVGAAVSMPSTNIYVGLSYLLQALLIVPPLLVLSQKMKHNQNIAPILKWAAIAAPLFAFALWLKYAFLWIDT